MKIRTAQIKLDSLSLERFQNPLISKGNSVLIRSYISIIMFNKIPIGKQCTHLDLGPLVPKKISKDERIQQLELINKTLKFI